MKHLLLISFVAVLFGCAGERDYPEIKKLSEYKQTEFVITPQNKISKGKNAVYSAPMLLCWQEVRAISENQLKIEGQYKDLLLLNNSESYKNTLKKGEYKAAAEFDVEPGKVNIYAEFTKSLPFAVKFKNFDDFKFGNKPVKSFGINYDEPDHSVHVLYYKNDNDFIIRLIPSNTEQEIILYMPKGKPDNMQQLFDIIANKIKDGRKDIETESNRWKYLLDDYGDEVRVPKIIFNIETNYETLEGNSFMLKQQKYFIEKAYQRTAFILDETGAKAESEASMEVTTEETPEPVEKPHPQKLHFNKPFLVVLKRKDSPNPYFAMWVDNTELMQK